MKGGLLVRKREIGRWRNLGLGEQAKVMVKIGVDKEDRWNNERGKKERNNTIVLASVPCDFKLKSASTFHMKNEPRRKIAVFDRSAPAKMYGNFAQKEAAFAREKCRAKMQQKRGKRATTTCCCELLCVATRGALTSPKVWNIVLSVVNKCMKFWIFLEVCVNCYKLYTTPQKNHFFIFSEEKLIFINSCILFWFIKK